MLLFPRTLLLLSRFRRARNGGAAVEFALIAVPFFMMLYAVFDIALIFFASTTLENGIAAAARQIRTGQAQASNMTQVQFRTLVCSQISMLLACDARLGLDVRKYSGFNAAKTPPAALDSNGNLNANFTYDPGNSGDVIVVRAYYVWPVLMPTDTAFVNMAGGKRLLQASIAFRNEPFNTPLAGWGGS
jgi:Flp pilus assembly protein TadG